MRDGLSTLADQILYEGQGFARMLRDATFKAELVN